MIEQWCPNCQIYTDCTHKSYPINDIEDYWVWRVETICAKCGLTIGTYTESKDKIKAVE